MPLMSYETYRVPSSDLVHSPLSLMSYETYRVPSSELGALTAVTHVL
jgi:hypothetical protein